MGLLDPFWTAVDTTIAGAGGAVGGAIGSVGDGITQTGRSVGDGIANAANGYASYVNDTANYVRDATGASGVRKGTAVNPLGLSQEKGAAWSYGAPSSWKSGSGAKSGPQKQITSASTTPAGQKKTANPMAQRAAVGTAAKSARGGTGGASGRGGAKPNTSTVTGRKEAGQMSNKGAVSAGRGGGQAGRGGQRVGGTVTGKKEAKQLSNKGAAGQAKKPTGTVTGGTVKRPTQIKK